MRLRLALLVAGVSLLAPAQTKLSVERLASFVRSAVQLKQPDKQVAAYLDKVELRERLDDATFEELSRLGAGPRTMQALTALRDASRSLPAAPKPAPPPPPPPPIPPPDSVEQQRIIEQVREYALNYTKNLPDFICTQVTRRYVDPSGMEYWRQHDTLTARVAYSEHREDYKLVLVNNQLVRDVSFQSLGGTTSAGEFGSLMYELFTPAAEAAFGWERWATLRGRRAYVFTYRVAQSRSKWHVIYEHTNDVVPAYHGLVFVDRDLLAVLRITLVAELPPDFPVQQTMTTLDYDWAEIAGHQYMLPLKAVVRMGQARYLTKNDVEFRLYRKFTAESTITFTPDALPEDRTVEQPPK
ncbi:MAG: hypothetical protein ABSD27_05035 [Bryobacteraceae bacterium]|jgi:hypothetical protein